MAIYVQHNSQQQGPYTAAEVKSQLASGALSVLDHVWWKGQDGWVPLGESSLMKGGFQELPGTEKKTEAPKSGLSPSALGSFLCSFLSLIGGPLATIPGIILGHLGLREIKQNPPMTGRKLAIAGLILNYVMTVVSVTFLVSYFMFWDQIQQENERQAAMTNLPPPLPSLPMTPAAPPQPAPVVAPENVVTNAAPATNAPEAAVPPAMTNTPAATEMTNSIPAPAEPATNAPDDNPKTGPMK